MSMRRWSVVGVGICVLGFSSHIVMPWSRQFGNKPLSGAAVSIVASKAELDAYCSPLLAKAPMVVHELAAEVRQSESPDVLVWGSGAVTLACGVPRPAELQADSSAQVLRINDVDFVIKTGRHFVDYVSIDRELYVLIRVSRTLDSSPVPPLATLIERSMTRVCETQGYAEVHPSDRLCTRRG